MVPILYQNSLRKSALFFFIIGTIGFFLMDSNNSTFWDVLQYITFNIVLISFFSVYKRHLYLMVSQIELSSFKYGTQYLISFFWTILYIDTMFDMEIYFTLQEGLLIFLLTFMVFNFLLRINPQLFENYMK